MQNLAHHGARLPICELGDDFAAFFKLLHGAHHNPFAIAQQAESPLELVCGRKCLQQLLGMPQGLATTGQKGEGIYSR